MRLKSNMMEIHRIVSKKSSIACVVIKELIFMMRESFLLQLHQPKIKRILNMSLILKVMILKIWLQIDFKDKKIHPTHYSIQTPSNHEHGDKQCPVNWCIEVSNSISYF